MNVPRGSSGQAMTGLLAIKSLPPLGLWARRARCASSDPDAFFMSRRQVAAKAVCAPCPVRHECLEHALTAPEEFGVWGGLDEDERKALARQRRRPAARGSVA